MFDHHCRVNSENTTSASKYWEISLTTFYLWLPTPIHVCNFFSFWLHDGFVLPNKLCSHESVFLLYFTITIEMCYQRKNKFSHCPIVWIFQESVKCILLGLNCDNGSLIPFKNAL